MAGLAEAVVLFLLMFFILTFNIIILIVFCGTNRNMARNVNKFFFLCHTIADLLIGLLIMPLAFGAAVAASKSNTAVTTWVFGQPLCETVAFLILILILVVLFMMLAISADHYVAIRWPNRYPAVCSPTRSVCWTVVLCVTASLICLPSTISPAQSFFSRRVYICSVNWAKEQSYFASMGVILCTPLIAGLIFSNSYTLTASYRKAIQPLMIPERGGSMRSDRPTNYRVHCLYSLIFFLVWMPWLLLVIIDGARGFPVSTPDPVYFCLFWLGIGNAAWKFIIYILGCPDFRLGIKILLLRMRVLKFCVCDQTSPIMYETT